MRHQNNFPDFVTEFHCEGVIIYMTITGYRFPDPGKLYGLPENCYPPEPSEWEVKDACIKVRDYEAERDKYGRSAINEREYIMKDVDLPYAFIDALVEANIDDLWDRIDNDAADIDDARRQDYYDSITERDR
jgi:hypothetical protein